MKTKPDWQFADTGPGIERGRKTRIIMLIGAWLAFINLLVAAAAPLARIYLDLPTMTAFTVFFASILIGLLLAAEGLLMIVVIAIRRLSSLWKRGLIMVLLGMVPLTSVIFTIGPERFKSPMIHDITTDMDDPPEFNQARSLRSAGDNTLEYEGEEIAEQQKQAYPGIKPIIEELSRDEALSRVVQVVLGLNWTLVNADFKTGIVEAYDTTRVFGFTDDIVIRVRTQGAGSRIDIRSVSRAGLGDAGMNAARIREFLASF